MRTQVPLDSISPLIGCHHENPFALLGPHQVEEDGRKALAVRAFLPDAKQAWVVDAAHGQHRPMRRIHPAGLYEAIHSTEDNGLCQLDGASYAIQVIDKNGKQTTMHDPYAFEPLLGEMDLHLLGEGKHWASYERLGAHLRTIDGVTGVNFAVWAPNAKGVSIVGDFNGWSAKLNQMRKHIPSGVWELFLPGLDEGTLYKFSVTQQDGRVVEKCDPYAFAAEIPPRTANIVTNLNQYTWGDSEWMAEREKLNAFDAPISIYELHLGSWRRDPSEPDRWLSYRETAPQLVEYCQQMGFTHVELMPVSEHPFTGSWGYQTVGYFAATSRYGSPEDLMHMIDVLHQGGIGVIIDWVPAHFPKDDHGLSSFDGSSLYEHSDPRQGEHPDWGTKIFNYGRNEVSNFLISNALFWLDKYHIDGLRVDAVASMLYLDYSREDGDWVPNRFGGRENLEAIDFLKRFNEETHLQYPGVLTIAEESTSWTGVSRPTYVGGLGFSLKWNMGWMNDTLRYFHHEGIHRKYHHDELTFSLIYAFTENFCLPFSHDEVVHGKGSMLDQMPGDMWQKFANLRLLYGYMWTHPGKKLLFMGGEFGQWHEWNYNESLQWHLLQWESHEGVQKYVSHLNHMYRNEPALHEVDFESGGFEWVDCHNHEDSVLAYLRRGKDPNDYLLVCSNFTPVPRQGYKIGVPEAIWYDEISNSDSTYFGGSDLGNGGGIQAAPLESHGRPASLEVTLPPLSTIVLKPRRS
ncbi:1,4-alpha-glucan branching enzyme GlgB [Posidoniimonas polymericola]|uniref:1,4-alpha-glucan branching enzyme GlgB n=1 Tax=Posidoniimonas polymericola TaxID=2528002 RepID=A0A5C5XYS5_9BACT|nr:1,4-alpha-glucan branching protein GlgB [Posidoniimonas polymericola]TWT67689.1 1,4-alpha-glucan branching enzyme GlgB [Posidoniimonas polymericola]